MKKYLNNQGQALITLLVFMLIGIIVTTTSIYLAINAATSISNSQNGTVAYYVAESGIEEALLRLLRNPGYTGENNVPVGNGMVDITVTGSTIKTITATGSVGNYSRTIQVIADYTNNILSINSWKEI